MLVAAHCNDIETTSTRSIARLVLMSRHLLMKSNVNLVVTRGQDQSLLNPSTHSRLVRSLTSRSNENRSCYKARQCWAGNCGTYLNKLVVLLEGSHKGQSRPGTKPRQDKNSRTTESARKALSSFRYTTNDIYQSD